MGLCARDHVISIHASLHWHLILYRIQYTVALTSSILINVLPILAISSPLSIITSHVNVSVRQSAPTT